MSPVSKTAIIAGGEQLSYDQLLTFADDIGTKARKRALVFFIPSNNIPSLVAYVGFIKNSIVPLMLKRETSVQQIIPLMEEYLPDYIWAPEGFCAALMRLGIEAEVVYSYEMYSLLAMKNEATCEMHPDAALLLSTSGSTGTPKYVRLSYENLRSNAQAISEYQKLTEFDRAITTLPFSYSYGLSIINSHLMSGASIVLTEESMFSRSFWDLLQESQPTNFGAVPYGYAMLERLHFDRIDTPGLRFLSQAGGKLSEKHQEAFASICASRGIEFYIMYGQTEATARMSWLPPENVAEKMGSIGIPIPGGEFELLDQMGNRVEGPNLRGSLIYRGQNVSLGYASNRKDLAKGDENKGCLTTGDIALRDEDGYYYIVGREKRFLKVYGNRVNLDDIEKMLLKKGFESACVGEDDHVEVYVLNEDTQVISKIISSETGLNPRAFSVERISGFPRNEAGKILYSELGK